MAFDNGIFSFKDFNKADKPNNNVFILITNPKNLQYKTGNNREPLDLIKNSTHLRFLIFSMNTQKLKNQVYIDGVLLGEARKVKEDSPLYVLEWNPKNYTNNIHTLELIIHVRLNF
jgi:hypothetical protein